jgi:hypothetical protein
MKNDAHTKHVANWIIMLFAILKVGYFGSYIARSAAAGKNILLDICVSCQPEISYNTLIAALTPK